MQKSLRRVNKSVDTALRSELLCLAGESTLAPIISQGRIDSQEQRILHFYICPSLR